LSIVLLGVHEEVAMQLELMWKILQVSIAQLEMLCICSVDLGAHAEVICNIDQGTLVWRTQEARLKLAHARELEHRG